MKVLKKAQIEANPKDTEHTKAERNILESIREGTTPLATPSPHPLPGFRCG